MLFRSAFGSPEYYKIKSKVNQNTLASGNNRIIVLMSANAIVDTAINRKNEKLFNQMLNELSSIGETNQKTDYLRIEFYHKMRGAVAVCPPVWAL